MAQCPCYATQVEDKAHILTCPDKQAWDLWNKSLKQIEDWLKQKGTDTYIQEQLMQTLRTWNLQENIHSDNEHLIQEQENIGKQYIWDGVVDHRMATSTRTDMETTLLMQIQPTVDCQNHKEVMECGMGYVGANGTKHYMDPHLIGKAY